MKQVQHTVHIDVQQKRVWYVVDCQRSWRCFLFHEWMGYRHQPIDTWQHKHPSLSAPPVSASIRHEKRPSCANYSFCAQPSTCCCCQTQRFSTLAQHHNHPATRVITLCCARCSHQSHSAGAFNSTAPHVRCTPEEPRKCVLKLLNASQSLERFQTKASTEQSWGFQQACKPGNQRLGKQWQPNSHTVQLLVLQAKATSPLEHA